MLQCCWQETLKQYCSKGTMNPQNMGCSGYSWKVPNHILAMTPP